MIESYINFFLPTCRMAASLAVADRLIAAVEAADTDMAVILGLLFTIERAFPESRLSSPIIQWFQETFPASASFVYVPKPNNTFTSISLRSGRKTCNACTPQKLAKQHGALIGVYRSMIGGIREELLNKLEKWSEDHFTANAKSERYLRTIQQFCNEIKALRTNLVTDLKASFPHRGSLLFIPSTDKRFHAVSYRSGRTLCLDCTLQQIARQMYTISRQYL